MKMVKLYIKIQQGDKETIPGSAYFSYGAVEVPNGIFISPIQYASNKDRGVIAACDAMPTTNAVEVPRLLEYLVGIDLLSLGNKPTFFNVVRREVIGGVP